MEMHSSRIFPHLKCSFGSIVRKTFSAIAKKKKPRNAFEDFTSPSLFSWTTETAGAYCSNDAVPAAAAGISGSSQLGSLCQDRRYGSDRQLQYKPRLPGTAFS
jgi:hypothetical protein